MGSEDPISVLSGRQPATFYYCKTSPSLQDARCTMQCSQRTQQRATRYTPAHTPEGSSLWLPLLLFVSISRPFSLSLSLCLWHCRHCLCLTQTNFLMFGGLARMYGHHERTHPHTQRAYSTPRTTGTPPRCHGEGYRYPCRHQRSKRHTTVWSITWPTMVLPTVIVVVVVLLPTLMVRVLAPGHGRMVAPESSRHPPISRLQR